MSESIGREAYETFADTYARLAEHKPHNAQYDRPAVLSLLPDLAGKDVLDAGCGPGFYAEIFVSRGARVTCVDVTPRMVELARNRLGDRATVLEADLAKPLPFPAESFDVITAPLVLDYITDLDALFGEFFRVLRPGGVCVYSLSNPVTNMGYYNLDSYFETGVKGSHWHGFGEPVYVKCVCRPLSAILNPMAKAGLILDCFHEPKPTQSFKEMNPDAYESLMRMPIFLCVRARKA